MTASWDDWITAPLSITPSALYAVSSPALSLPVCRSFLPPPNLCLLARGCFINVTSLYRRVHRIQLSRRRAAAASGRLFIKSTCRFRFVGGGLVISAEGYAAAWVHGAETIRSLMPCGAIFQIVTCSEVEYSGTSIICTRVAQTFYALSTYNVWEIFN